MLRRSFASCLIRLRPTSRCHPDYLSGYINSPAGRRWVSTVVSQQVGQANVNGSKLRALEIPLAPLAEQHRIVTEVERRFSGAEELEATVLANLKRAARLRQSILGRAFHGSWCRTLWAGGLTWVMSSEGTDERQDHSEGYVDGAQAAWATHQRPRVGRTIPSRPPGVSRCGRLRFPVRDSRHERRRGHRVHSEQPDRRRQIE